MAQHGDVEAELGSKIGEVWLLGGGWGLGVCWASPVVIIVGGRCPMLVGSCHDCTLSGREKTLLFWGDELFGKFWAWSGGSFWPNQDKL